MKMKPKIKNTVEILKDIREEIKNLGLKGITDGHTILISKPDTLEIIQDWIEYLLENPQ